MPPFALHSKLPAITFPLDGELLRDGRLRIVLPVSSTLARAVTNCDERMAQASQAAAI